MADDGLSNAERAEFARLRAEADDRHGHASGRGGRAWRWVGSIALLVVAALLLTTSVVAVFVRTQLLDTDRYVETIAPLARDPVIQDVITTRVTDEFMTKLDIAGLTQQLTTALKDRGAPEVIDQMVGPIVSGVRGFLSNEIGKVVRSDAFASVWDSANRVAHREIDALLTTGQGNLLSANGTEVSLNVGALITVVKQRLVDAGFGLAAKVPDSDITMPLFHAEQLPKIRTAVAALETLAWLLPLVGLIFLVAGVLVAPSRRRGLLIGAVAVGIGFLLLLAALAVARTYYLNNLPASIQSPEAVRIVYDTETRFLIAALQTLLVLLAIVAVLCLVCGPSGWARWLRALIDRGLDAAGRALGQTGLPLGPVPAAFRRARKAVIVGVVGLAVGILYLWRTPGIAGVVWLTVAVLVLLALVEVVARADRSPAQPVSAPTVSPA